MCPFCGSDTLVIIDGEEGDVEMVSDCENCCRPISVIAKVDGGQVEFIEVSG
jgi:hypothetical protein